MGLVSHTYWSRCIEAPSKPQVSKVLPVACDQDLVELVKQFIEDKPVLVITSEDAAAVIVNSIAGTVHVTQDTDPDSLRSCDTCPPSGKFTVFIVTDRLVVIGTDFRAPTTGMTQVLDRGLESDREAMQALSRVGRYGERCERMITSRTELIDVKLSKGLD